MERHHLGVTRNALRENRLVIFGLCSIGLRRHGPFISCHIFLPLCFALSGTHLGSSFFLGVSDPRPQWVPFRFSLLDLFETLAAWTSVKNGPHSSVMIFGGFQTATIGWLEHGDWMESMYLLLKMLKEMVIFQPAMLVHRRVVLLVPWLFMSIDPPCFVARFSGEATTEKLGGRWEIPDLT